LQDSVFSAQKGLFGSSSSPELFVHSGHSPNRANIRIYHVNDIYEETGSKTSLDICHGTQIG
jgi:hypothetical protein